MSCCSEEGWGLRFVLSGCGSRAFGHKRNGATEAAPFQTVKKTYRELSEGPQPL